MMTAGEIYRELSKFGFWAAQSRKMRWIAARYYAGVESLDELTATTGCGSSCGCCKELALQILDEHRRVLPLVA